MLELINRTEDAAEIFRGWAPDHSSVAILAVRTRYHFGPAGLGERGSTEIEPSDRYYGSPADSSLARAGDGVPFKTGTDCLFYGTARPPRDGMRGCGVRVTANTAAGGFDKSLRVAGRRYWQRSPVGLVPSKPEPVQPTPLCYEYAFGGVDRKARELETRNPVGMGLNERRITAKGAELPRIEYPKAAMTSWSKRPPPAGLGPIAPGWEPRRRRNDQLDTEALAAGLCPYPDPVPEGLYNTAPEDQRLPAPVTGGERLMLTGFGQACPSPIQLTLPKPDLHLRVTDGHHASTVELTTDTVEIDADAGTLDLLARARVPDSELDTQSRWLVLTRDDNDQAKEAAA